MVSINTQLPDCREIGSRDLTPWLAALCAERREEDAALIREALAVTLELHRDHAAEGDHSGLRACLVVADILGELRLDGETLAAALLHNVLELPGCSAEQLAARLGATVSQMVVQSSRVAEFTYLTDESAHRNDAAHLENLRRLLLGIADDIRTLLIVLAKQVYRMRTIKGASIPIQRSEARDTRDIYAPLANRLGIWQLKWELEDLALRYLEPEEYRRIAGMLDGRRADRERYISEVMALLRTQFAAAGVAAEVMGRPKHIYSIWKKMRRKRVSIDQIFDLRAVRVMVEDITACYTVLGIVHGSWRHIPGEFDDYVATPKPNGYRSIHTAVIGPEEKTLEIQIRTREMHEHSELGVAAHWRYKEQGKQDADFERRIVLMRNWLEMRDEEGEPTAASVEETLNEEEGRAIYLFTPHGKVVELPHGSTALDFAYAIHTQIGHRCRGAKADGRITPLNQALQSGQMVEILTIKEGGPSRDWVSPHLGYLHTARARNRVRQWFKQQDYDAHLQIGRAALEKEISRLGTERPDLAKVAERFHCKGAEELLAAIGRGEVSPLQVASLGVERRGAEQQPTIRAHPPARTKKHKRRKSKGEPQIVVEGLDSLLIVKAKCCQPVPGDPIIGYISQGKGIKVHCADCAKLGRLLEENPKRAIEVEWEISTGSSSTIDLHILAQDRRRLLTDISTLLSDEGINVLAVNTQSDRAKETAAMRFTLEIDNLEQLSKVFDKIGQMPEVIKVHRES